MTEHEALDLVLRNAKRTCVYSDEYRRLIKDLGIVRYMDLSTFCKQQGARDICEWLISHGLYRNVERDMRDNGETIVVQDSDSVEEICARILENYPLAGEPVLSEEVLKKIFAKAQKIFDYIAEYGKTELSPDERDVMTIAIVQHIKRRHFQEGNRSDDQFWYYIYTQFGFKKSDNNRANTQRIYTVLRAAVRGAFLQHDRFFSSDKETHQYYTSLMLHALSPMESMESLFEILLFFYVNDLEFSYIPEDPIFKALVKCIATRWDTDIELQEKLNVRSNAMASGLKALFKERPDFMRIFCERIVRHIDALVHNIDTTRQDSSLDNLLRQWYAKKDYALKERVSGEKVRNRGSWRTVSSEDSIRVRYVLDDRKVCISIPSIRLEDKGDTVPYLEIYQGEKIIYSSEMDVFGRLSWTTREILICLDDTDLDYKKRLDIEASIHYKERTLLERNSKLHRNFIIFDESGRETSSQANKEGFYWLFANASAQIDTGSIDPEWIDSDGQLMRLYADGSNAVYVDGAELFLSRDRQGDIRCYPAISKVDAVRGRIEGKAFNLYSEAFMLDMRLPADKRSLNYRINIDGNVEPLSKYCPDGQTSFILIAPDAPVKYHSIRIMELSTERIACSFDYAILPDIRCSFNNDLIYDDGSLVTVRVHYDGCDITSREHPAEGTDWVMLSAAHLNYDLEVLLPLVRGTIQEDSIFGLPPVIWKEKLIDTAFVKIHTPINWNCWVYLGATEVPQNATNGIYELGNYIRTYKNRNKADDLMLVLKNAQGDLQTRILTKIIFEEHFTESPVAIEEGMLRWLPVGRYIGGVNDEFQLIIDVPVEGSPFVYRLYYRNTVADKNFGKDFPCGEFPFKIVKKNKMMFGNGIEKVLYEGMLAIGTLEERRVLGKYLYLTRARCWDLSDGKMLNMEMSDTAGCLSNLQFQGFSIPSGEELEYPEYIADLYFYNPSVGKWQYFNDKERPGFELINPVHVWIISEQLMIIKTAEDEAPYLDKQYHTILNRTLDLPNSLLNFRLVLPDYFEYRME